jgi:predicted Zn-ribbon and HTH transcriptional regulator
MFGKRKPTEKAPEQQPARDAALLDLPEESHLRERMQAAEKGHQLRPGALCPKCGGHAFRRAELKSGSACPKCGTTPRAA